MIRRAPTSCDPGPGKPQFFWLVVRLFGGDGAITDATNWNRNEARNKDRAGRSEWWQSRSTRFGQGYASWAAASRF
jgi:hypothetical protein